MSLFSLEAILTMKDGITAPFRAATQSVTAGATQMRNSMATVTSAAQTTATATSGLSKAAGVLKSAILPLLALTTIAGGISKGVASFKDYDAAMANMRAGLESTKGAIGLTENQLVSMAGKLSSESIYGKTAIINAQTQLMTFGNVGKENLERITKAAMDVDLKLNGVNANAGTLQQMTIMLGKAMDNPVRGMMAMSKRGIQFTEVQRNMIKSMVAHGDILGAQKYMMDEIENKYGKTSEAFRKTAAGMELVRNQKMNEQWRKIGAELVPLITQFQDLVLTVLPGFIDVSAKALKIIKDYEEPILAVVAALVAYKVAVKVNMALNWAGELVKTARLLYGVSAAQGVLNTLQATYNLLMLKANTLMIANPFGLLAIGIVAAVAGVALLVYYWDDLNQYLSDIGWIDAVNMAWKGIVKAAKWCWEQIKNIIGMYVGVYVAIFENFGNLVSGIWEGIKTVGIAIWNIITGIITGNFDKVGKGIDKFGEGVKKIFTAIKDYIISIFEGPLKFVSGIIAGVGKIAGSVVRGAIASGAETAGALAGGGSYQAGIPGGGARSYSPDSFRSETTSRSKVDVNFGNVPKGTTIKRSGSQSKDITVNTGQNPY